jgi:hypothetical protein
MLPTGTQLERTRVVGGQWAPAQCRAGSEHIHHPTHAAMPGGDHGCDLAERQDSEDSRVCAARQLDELARFGAVPGCVRNMGKA